MAYKLLKTVIIFGLLSFCCGCINMGDKCEGNGGRKTIDDLIIISPLQTNYNQGDEITVKLTLPLDYSQSIFQRTNNYIGIFGFSQFLDPARNLFIGNTITYIKGSPSVGDGNSFVIPFNFQTGKYEFEIKVKLNRTGNYSIPSNKQSDSITFDAPNECEKVIIIETNKINPSGTNDFNFTVI